MATYALPLSRGAYQDNGASPWFSFVPVGSQGLSMKLALDTGTNMDWVTSTQCNTPACTQAGRVRFDPATSSTFKWIDQNEIKLSYGPWGDLYANLGQDEIALPGGPKTRITMGLAKDYEGEKFMEVDWDGCIALPSAGPMQHGMSFLFQDMVGSGNGGGMAPMFGVDTDANTQTGQCIFGGYDINQIDTSSALLLPFGLYSIVPYLWTTPLAEVVFDGVEICQDATFCLDTGSSRFKGDGKFMDHILHLAQNNPGDLNITVGSDPNGNPGRLVVPPSVYTETVEAGPGNGETSPQFHELGGVTGLFLAGSLLMDHLYAIHCYSSLSDAETGALTLQPAGMIITNKPGGPKIIQNSTTTSTDVDTLLAELFKRAKVGDSTMTTDNETLLGQLTGLWKNAYKSQLNLSAAGNGLLKGIYESTAGSSGKYWAYGFVDPKLPPIQPDSAKEGSQVGQPFVLMVNWRSFDPNSTPDPTWNYVSGLAGQIIYDDFDAKTLQLNHALIASQSYDAVNVRPGAYVDRLEYDVKTAVDGAAIDEAPEIMELNTSSAVTWTSPEAPGLSLAFEYPIAQSVFFAQCTQPSGVKATMLGTANALYQPAPNSYQSIALSVVYTDPDSQAPTAVAYAGWIDPTTKRMRLQEYMSTGRSWDLRFFQSRARTLYFTPS